MNAEGNGHCIIFKDFGKQQLTDINRSSNTDGIHICNSIVSDGKLQQRIKFNFENEQSTGGYGKKDGN